MRGEKGLQLLRGAGLVDACSVQTWTLHAIEANAPNGV